MESIETKALRRIEAATQKLMFQAETVAYAIAASHYPVEITRSVETGSTNGRVRKYNPDFVLSLTMPQLMFLISHESDHDLKKHIFRIGNRNLKLANQAADYQVNGDILKIPFLKAPQLPNGGKICFDKRFDGMDFESIYRVLEAEKQAEEDKQKQQQKQDKQDSQDNESDDNESDDDNDSSDNGDDSSDNQDDSDETDDSSDSDKGDSDNGDQEETDDTEDSDDDQDSSGDDAADESGDNETSGGNGDESDSENDTISDDSAANDDDNGNSKDSAATQGANDTEGNDESHVIPDCGGCGSLERPDFSAAERADEESNLDVIIAQALSAASRLAGTLPGNLEGIAIEKRRVEQNWEREMQEFFTTSTKTDFTFSRPDPRVSGSDFIFPSEVSDGINHFGVAVDFSYSIQAEWLSRFVANLQAIMDTGVVDKFTVVLFHTSVFQSFEFTRGDTVEIDTAERGGTLFAPVFEWFRENAPDIAGLCMLTDLEPGESWNQAGEWCPALNDVKPDCPVLFAVYGDVFTSRRYIAEHADNADFGRCIPLWDN